MLIIKQKFATSALQSTAKTRHKFTMRAGL